MKYAIIEDGGKQYKVVEGGSIDVDHYKTEIGEQIDLDRVLLIADNDEITIGTPYITGAKVEAKIDSHFKAPKIIVFKYKPRIRYRVKSGHRQLYTLLKVDSIVTPKPAEKKTASKEAAKPAAKTTAKKTTAKPKTTAKKPAAATKTTTKKTSSTPKTTAKKPAATTKSTTKKTTTTPKTTAKKTSTRSSQSAQKK